MAVLIQLRQLSYHPDICTHFNDFNAILEQRSPFRTIFPRRCIFTMVQNTSKLFRRFSFYPLLTQKYFVFHAVGKLDGQKIHILIAIEKFSQFPFRVKRVSQKPNRSPLFKNFQISAVFQQTILNNNNTFILSYKRKYI